ncbi:MAG: hypothetical protein MR928_01270, partial [Bacteroidales bacterium]|nr:hypothetical protein [Bacteroidales bacterium]
MLPNRQWNKKQKHKKTALEQCGMLRIWRSQKAVFYVFVSVPLTSSTCHPKFVGKERCNAL